MGKVQRVVSAYVLASGAVAPMAWVLSWWPERAFGNAMPPFEVVYPPLWAIVVGIPSCGWAARHLSRSLGIREGPVLKVARGDLRSVPVAGDVLADATRMVFGRGGGKHGRSFASLRMTGRNRIRVADEIVLACDGYDFSEDDLQFVLRRGWIRQRAGRAALGRSYWLGREPFWGDRRKYEALAEALAAAGILVGRGDRRSGRLVVPPLSAVYDLRHMVG